MRFTMHITMHFLNAVLHPMAQVRYFFMKFACNLKRLSLLAFTAGYWFFVEWV
jgi:hypothetical protein